MTNIDLRRWCDFLSIYITGIYARDEHMPQKHSPCIINLDDYEGVGSHWVCCVPGHKKETLWYYDSFGMSYPDEFKHRAKQDGIVEIQYNASQYQHKRSVLCGYYVIFVLYQTLVFKKDYSKILSPFSETDMLYNEQLITNFFKTI